MFPRGYFPTWYFPTWYYPVGPTPSPPPPPPFPFLPGNLLRFTGIDPGVMFDGRVPDKVFFGNDPGTDFSGVGL